MSLDLDKALSVASQHATMCTRSYRDILSHPIRRFRHPPSRATSEMRSTFWTFVIVSIFLGSTVDAAISHFALPEFATTLVITILCWGAFCVAMHGVCRLLRARGTFENSFVVSFQILSVAYIISHLSAFAVSRIPIFTPGYEIAYGVATYLTVQAIFLVVYWPMALKATHRLSAWSWLVLPPVILIGFTGLNYLLFGYGLIVGWDLKHVMS